MTTKATKKTDDRWREPLGIDSPKSDEKDPVDHFYEWAREGAKRQVTLAQRSAPYADFHEYEDEDGITRQLSIDKFLLLSHLVAYDTFQGQTPDKDLFRLLFKGRVGPDVDWEGALKKLRAHPVYPRLRQRLKEAMRALSDAGDVESWKKLMSRIAPEEAAFQVISAPKARDRIKATIQYLDRLEPKQTRGAGGGQLMIVLPPGQAEETMKTLELMKGLDWRPDPAVSAKRLNVPRDED